MKRLRLVLGDQLNLQHSWFSETDGEVTYLMAEMRQETDYVTHHIQKVVAFFLSMRNFADQLRSKGHSVVYLPINHPDNPQKLERLLLEQIREMGAEKFEYQLPDEYRLDCQLRELCSHLPVPSESYDTEHFYMPRDAVSTFFKKRKRVVMEPFYRMMREKFDILMESGQPEGGQWNYDSSNRKKWTGSPEIPEEINFPKDVTEVVRELESAGVKTFGKIDTSAFPWPTSRQEGLKVLKYFCDNLLPDFGDFQDAMSSGERFLFHSRLSFALNSKMIAPAEVVEVAVKAYRKAEDKTGLSQVEGFVRQVLGWREFVRGIYWMEMPGYKELNSLGHQRKLPAFYWSGETDMHCLKQCVSQSLEDAYAHHIQRLMVLGNFALLAEVSPDAVDEWYLGVYIDAIEWVELPNTRGMSQFADGGLLATKPYVSSANYINKMSDYCPGCKYDPGKRTGKDACPFNALYWNFLDQNRERFSENRRMSLMISLLDKIPQEELRAMKERAREILESPDHF